MTGPTTLACRALLVRHAASERGIFVVVDAPNTTAARHRTRGDIARGQALSQGKARALAAIASGPAVRVSDPISPISECARGTCFQDAVALRRDPARNRRPDPALSGGRVGAFASRPRGEILPSNRTVRLVTRDGDPMTARVLNQDTFSLQLIDTKERVFSIPKSELREFDLDQDSSDAVLRGKLTPGSSPTSSPTCSR